MTKKRIPRLRTDQATAAYWERQSFADVAEDTREATIRFVKKPREQERRTYVMSRLTAIAASLATALLALASCAVHQPVQPTAPLEFPEAKVVHYEETYRPLSEEELKAMHERSNPVSHSGPYTPRRAASDYLPLVDPATITDQEKFRLDLAQCGDLASANTARDQALSSGVGGAAAGAAFGALMGLAVGLKPGQLAPAGALGGGVGGLSTGAVNQEATYQQIYKNCMIGRGWNVLR